MSATTRQKAMKSEWKIPTSRNQGKQAHQATESSADDSSSSDDSGTTEPQPEQPKPLLNCILDRTYTFSLQEPTILVLPADLEK
jgi:hypothetical protein